MTESAAWTFPFQPEHLDPDIVAGLSSPDPLLQLRNTQRVRHMLSRSERRCPQCPLQSEVALSPRSPCRPTRAHRRGRQFRGRAQTGGLSGPRGQRGVAGAVSLPLCLPCGPQLSLSRSSRPAGASPTCAAATRWRPGPWWMPALCPPSSASSPRPRSSYASRQFGLSATSPATGLKNATFCCR